MYASKEFEGFGPLSGVRVVELAEWVAAVSYTHLDVYKRQVPFIISFLISLLLIVYIPWFSTFLYLGQ